MFANGPAVLISSGVNSGGAVVEAGEGGWLLSGTWEFSSGIDYADWVLLAAQLPGLPKVAGSVGDLVLVPRREGRINDNWRVVGLKGTGSKGFIIDEPTFVPEHRRLDLADAEGSDAQSLHHRASYGIPNTISLNHVCIGAFVGAARNAVDTLTAQLVERRDSFTGARKRDVVSLQMAIGASAAEIDAALSLARADMTEMLELGAGHQPLTPDQRATFRLHHGYNMLLARRAVERVYNVSGISGLAAGSVLARAFADVYAGSKHNTLLWDELAESYGRVRLGLAPNALQH